jgi:hypothetical protein
MLADNSEYAGQYAGVSDEHQSVQVRDLIPKLDHVYTSSLLSVRLQWIEHGFVYAFKD